MPLPVGFAQSEIQVKGQPVTFRALSRSEGLRLSTWDRSEADAAEVWIIAQSCGVSEAEAQSFMTGTDYAAVTELLTAILVLSGLSTPAGGRDPKPPTSGR